MLNMWFRASNGHLIPVPCLDRVYIVLRFKGRETRVLGVYETRDAAEIHVSNLCRKLGHVLKDYGIIEKKIRPC